MIKQYTLRNAEYIKLIVNQTLKHTINLLHNVFRIRFTIYPKLSQIESEKMYNTTKLIRFIKNIETSIYGLIFYDLFKER